MSINFENSMNEVDFKQALLSANEERVARELRPEADLDVDGLNGSFLGRLLGFFSGRSR